MHGNARIKAVRIDVRKYKRSEVDGEKVAFPGDCLEEVFSREKKDKKFDRITPNFDSDT